MGRRREAGESSRKYAVAAMAPPAGPALRDVSLWSVVAGGHRFWSRPAEERRVYVLLRQCTLFVSKSSTRERAVGLQALAGATH